MNRHHFISRQINDQYRSLTDIKKNITYLTRHRNNRSTEWRFSTTTEQQNILNANMRLYTTILGHIEFLYEQLHMQENAPMMNGTSDIAYINGQYYDIDSFRNHVNERRDPPIRPSAQNHQQRYRQGARSSTFSNQQEMGSRAGTGQHETNVTNGSGSRGPENTETPVNQDTTTTRSTPHTGNLPPRARRARNTDSLLFDQPIQAPLQEASRLLFPSLFNTAQNTNTNIFNYTGLQEEDLLGSNLVNELLNTRPLQTFRPLFENVVVAPSPDQIRNAVTYTSFSAIRDPMNSQCPISLERFSPTTEVGIIHECRHIFNRDSISRWLDANVRCPVCRFDIRETTEGAHVPLNTQEHDDGHSNTEDNHTDNPEINEPATETPDIIDDIENQLYSDINSDINTDTTETNDNNDNNTEIPVIFDDVVSHDVPLNDTNTANSMSGAPNIPRAHLERQTNINNPLVGPVQDEVNDNPELVQLMREAFSLLQPQEIPNPNLRARSAALESSAINIISNHLTGQLNTAELGNQILTNLFTNNDIHNLSMDPSSNAISFETTVYTPNSQQQHEHQEDNDGV